MSDAIATATVVPKRNGHRLQRIFRSSKGKLQVRPFHGVTAEGAERALELSNVTAARVRELTAQLIAGDEDRAKALAEQEPVPAAVAALQARASRFGVQFSNPKQAADPAAATALGDLVQDTAAQQQRANRFTSEADKAAAAAAEARQSRFGTAAAAPQKIEIVLTPELQAEFDARARRFATA